jgi:uncharacterized protein (TIGR02266 family)
MSTPKIHLVDDTKLFLELEKSFLKFAPVRILTAANGREALDVIKKERPDLIYMDLHMPQMDGAECCSVIKADPSFRTIPVIMVTSAGKEEDVRLCREAGCDDYLTKPVNRRIFLEKGRKYLLRIDRRESRVPYRTPVKFRAHNLHLSGVSADISPGGIFVATEYDIEPETTLELTFALPDNSCMLQGIKGRVAWQNSRKNIVQRDMPPGFGVEFLGLRQEESDVISAFVKINRW